MTRSLPTMAVELLAVTAHLEAECSGSRDLRALSSRLPAEGKMDGEPYGEARVEQPETSGGAMQRYTTYLVHAQLKTSPAVPFCTRKRYSDFEWLRKTLVAHFPGVRVPPLPKKQRTGRFEEAFIEARRGGLEEFLQRCLGRRQLAIDSPTLRRFLEAPEDAMEELKKDFDKRTVEVKCQEFKVAFAQELRVLGLPADDSRLVTCRSFLESQTTKLRDLLAVFRDLVDAQRAVTSAVVGAQDRLANVCSDESSALADAQAIEQPRIELLAAFRQQSEAMEEAPAQHYDFLLTATERELVEAEAMQEALESLDALQQGLQDVKRKVSTLEAQYARLVGNEEPPSTLGKLLTFRQKDPGTQREEMNTELEQRTSESVTTEEFYLAARTISIGQEVDRYLAEKVAMHREAKDTFARQARETAERMASIWGSTLPRLIEGQLGLS
mmetsp:Transcript_55478/g.154642  ORF Transcript_55478/g.154642 Transcript_55478/m.154642 type:complete len:441 (-) Transcript_55478:98-1420(-)